MEGQGLDRIDGLGVNAPAGLQFADTAVNELPHVGAAGIALMVQAAGPFLGDAAGLGAVLGDQPLGGDPGFETFVHDPLIINE